MKYSQFSVASAVLSGVVAEPIYVEVATQEGMPGLFIVGMSGEEAGWTWQKVKCALRSAGFSIPNGQIIVNLVPSSIKKEDPSLEVAIGILVATGQISPKMVENRLFAGELTLDGRVLPVRGTVAYASVARDLGYAFVGSTDCMDVVALEGIDQFGMGNLSDLRDRDLPTLLPQAQKRPSHSLDFREVIGQETAKRGLQIAAAGGHGVLIVGAPESNKTMLASCMPSILPPLDDDERFQAALIRSVARESLDEIIEGNRPMRIPHSTVTLAGMVGGGHPLLPGEVSFGI